MLEFRNTYLILLPLVIGILWALEFFKVWVVPQIYVPRRYTKGRRLFLRWLLLVIGIGGWILIGISLAGPRTSLGYVKKNAEVNDIFFVVDVSASMTGNDFRPNRLEAAKKKIVEFVELRPLDRIGIIIFAERAFTLLPLTADMKLIKRIVSEIKTNFTGIGNGTNMGDALALAVARGGQSLTKNKVVILLTDGVSNVGNLTPAQAAEEAKKQKIKTYTIGIGGDPNALMPAIDINGNSIVDNWGQPIMQKIPGGSVDLDTLKNISDITGGKAYRANDIRALQEVLTDIGKMERTKIDLNKQIVYREEYLKFLIWGMVLLLLAELGRKLILREGT